MHRYWDLFQKAIARLLAFTILSTSTLAFASLPGESNKYTAENVGVNNNPESLFSDNNYDEARLPNGTYIRVWRGTDNQVWISQQNRTPFTIGNTVTNYAPAVAYYGGNVFLIAHTGNDNHIYYTYYDASNFSNRGWFQVPGQSTIGPVSLTNVSAGSNFVFMTFLGTDLRLLGEYVSNGIWNFTGQIAGATSTTAPSVTYSPFTSTLWTVTAAGGQIWATWQAFGSSSWAGWQVVNSDGHAGVFTATPHIAVLPNGNLVISAVDTNNNPYFREFTYALTPLTSWSRDTTGFQTTQSVSLTAFAGVVYALLTGLNHMGYWKQVSNF